MRNIYANTKSKLAITVRAILTALIIFLIYWFMLPPIHFQSRDFWTFAIITALIIYFLNVFIFTRDRATEIFSNGKLRIKSLDKVTKWIAIIIIALLLIGLVADIVGSPFFFSGQYKDLIVRTEGDFSSEVAELSMSQIPIVDRDSASRLGLRKLGEMSDLVSQFEVTEDYIQINYHGSPYRITNLAYGDLFKWLGNREDGIPGYILVNMTTQETTLVRLDKGIKYSESEYFMRNINRYLRFNYPTKIFEDIHLEVDENGTPFWIAPTVHYEIALWSGRDIAGAVLVNAVTGESRYYDCSDIPAWVDQVFVSDLVIEQLTYNGQYQSGYLNSIFGQKGVLQTTDGYNYITIGDDVWLYTGMTSVAGDESNVGFVLVNLRTKETKYYAVPGAEEFSAMSSAEGQVQNLKYESTFPILLNVADRPTYFMSLKDDAGLVKMYAFVDVQQYQIVATGTTVSEARENYSKKLAENGADIEDNSKPVTETVKGTVSGIAAAVENGNSCYYIRIEGDGRIFKADISVSAELPFVAVGDELEFEISSEDEGTPVIILSIK